MGKSELQQILSTLTTAERIKLAEELWDSVAREVEGQPLKPHELAEVKQRLDEHRANPEDVVPWSQVKKALGLPD